MSKPGPHRPKRHRRWFGGLELGPESARSITRDRAEEGLFFQAFFRTQQQLRAGKPAIKCCHGDGSYLAALCAETGVPIRLTGDVVVFDGPNQGVNAAVNRHALEHGRPWNTRKEHLAVLADPQAYFRHHERRAVVVGRQPQLIQRGALDLTIRLNDDPTHLKLRPALEVSRKGTLVPNLAHREVAAFYEPWADEVFARFQSRWGDRHGAHEPLPRLSRYYPPIVNPGYTRNYIRLHWADTARSIQCVDVTGSGSLLALRFADFQNPNLAQYNGGVSYAVADLDLGELLPRTLHGNDISYLEDRLNFFCPGPL